MHAPRYISTAGVFLVTNVGETLAFTCMVGPALKHLNYSVNDGSQRNILSSTLISASVLHSVFVVSLLLLACSLLSLQSGCSRCLSLPEPADLGAAPQFIFSLKPAVLSPQAHLPWSSLLWLL